MISGVVVRVRGGRFGTVTMKSSVAVWVRQTSVTDTEKVCVLLGETEKLQRIRLQALQCDCFLKKACIVSSSSCSLLTA